MSEHATTLMNYLKRLKVDYSLLLLLTAPKYIVSSHGCTAYLDKMYYQMILEPFCRGVIIDLVKPTPEATKAMLDYCESQSSEFLRNPTKCLAGLRALCPSLPEALQTELDEEIELNRPNFERFFLAVSEDVQIFVPSVDPGKYLCAFTKKEAIERYERSKSKWGQHNPSFFQTYDMDVDENGKPVVAPGSSVFVIFRNPSDAVRAVAGYLIDGKIGVPERGDRVVFRKVMGVNELYLENALCNFVLDCELTVSFHGGRRTAGEIRASMDRFVSRLLRFWDVERIVPWGNFVGVAIKDKSRPLPKGDYKVSIHAVPGIIATRAQHNAAQKRFLEARDPETGLRQCDLIAKAKDAANRNGGALPEDFPLHDLESWDFSAGKSNGIATQFSRKRAEDPFSTFQGTDVYLAGVKVDEERCDIPTPHDPKTLSREQAMQILWQLCSSTPKYVTEACYPTAYSEEFVAQVAREAQKPPKVFCFFAPIGIRTHSPLMVGAGGWGRTGPRTRRRSGQLLLQPLRPAGVAHFSAPQTLRQAGGRACRTRRIPGDPIHPPSGAPGQGGDCVLLPGRVRPRHCQREDGEGDPEAPRWQRSVCGVLCCSSRRLPDMHHGGSRT